jgi:hypothetical protein
MPVHDGTRVDAGVYHDFHNVWIGALRNALNGGVLPASYYAMSEQHAGKFIADVLTLHGDTPAPEPLPRLTSGGVAVAEAPPRVRRQLSLSGSARSLRKTLTVRHVSGHRIVALLEMVSPANKDRREHVDEFVDKGGSCAAPRHSYSSCRSFPAEGARSAWHARGRVGTGRRAHDPGGLRCSQSGTNLS